MNNTSPL